MSCVVEMAAAGGSQAGCNTWQHLGCSHAAYEMHHSSSMQQRAHRALAPCPDGRLQFQHCCPVRVWPLEEAAAGTGQDGRVGGMRHEGVHTTPATLTACPRLATCSQTCTGLTSTCNNVSNARQKQHQACYTRAVGFSPVAAQNLLSAVSTQAQEGVGGKDNGAVGQRGVGNHEVLQRGGAGMGKLSQRSPAVQPSTDMRAQNCLPLTASTTRTAAEASQLAPSIAPRPSIARTD